MAGKERQLTTTVLNAGAGDANSDWQELTGFRASTFTATITLTVSAATLQGVLRVRGTNNFPQNAVATEPLMAAGTLVSAADAAMAHAAGVITVNNPSIGTHIIVLTWPALPQWQMWEWDFTGGGGTVALAVRTAGW